MQSITKHEVLDADHGEADFRPGMTVVARMEGHCWARGAKGLICARRTAELLPPLGDVALFVVMFETGLQTEMTAAALRRTFLVSMDIHSSFQGYEFKSTRDLHVDFYAGRFGAIFLRKGVK